MDRLVETLTGNKARRIMDKITMVVIVLAVIYFGFQFIRGLLI